MPSNFTKNYSLSQWERSDKVLMDDFNADNAKIDAAFFNHPSAELIASGVEPENGNSYLKLDISQVDWSRYLMLILRVDPAEAKGFSVSMGSGMEVNGYVYANGVSSISTGTNASLLRVNHISHMSMLIPVLYNGGHAPIVLSFGAGIYNQFNEKQRESFFSGGGGEYPLSQCSYLGVSCAGGSFTPGDKAVLWGVK